MSSKVGDRESSNRVGQKASSLKIVVKRPLNATQKHDCLIKTVNLVIASPSPPVEANMLVRTDMFAVLSN